MSVERVAQLAALADSVEGEAIRCFFSGVLQCNDDVQQVLFDADGTTKSALLKAAWVLPALLDEVPACGGGGWLYHDSIVGLGVVRRSGEQLTIETVECAAISRETAVYVVKR